MPRKRRTQPLEPLIRVTMVTNDTNGYYTSIQQANARAGEAREKQIREMPAAELEAFCHPNELAGERNKRQYYAQMNQPELEKQAAYNPWAAIELDRRNGVVPR